MPQQVKHPSQQQAQRPVTPRAPLQVTRQALPQGILQSLSLLLEEEEYRTTRREP